MLREFLAQDAAERKGRQIHLPRAAVGADTAPVTDIDSTADQDRLVRRERYELLRHVNRATDKPLIALSFVWLGLLVIDLTRGLSRPMEIAHYSIWALFIADFLIEFIIAPRKLKYLKRNVLTAIALVLPAVRVLQAFRFVHVLRLSRAARLAGTARVARSVRLVRVLTSLNRGMRASAAWLGRRGAGYVAAATILVTFGGAAGMWAFEHPTALRQAGYDATSPDAGIESYGEAIWWTAMLMTTMGSQYWPLTTEGRVLCFVLALYAFAVFGYITATLASYFVGRDQESGDVTPRELVRLREEVAALRAALQQHPPRPPALFDG
jgi:voltage-gated potassium channel